MLYNFIPFPIISFTKSMLFSNSDSLIKLIFLLSFCLIFSIRPTNLRPFSVDETYKSTSLFSLAFPLV